MLSGAQLLQSFDERLARAEREAAALEGEAASLAARRDSLRAVEAEALRELARLRFELLAGGEDAAAGPLGLDALEAAGVQVRAALEARARDLAALGAEIEAHRRALEAATAARGEAADRLRAVEAAARAAQQAARERLAADPEWQRLDALAEEAARTAQHAAQKAAFAAEDRDAKGRPYLEDPIFAYLWRRGYGTAAYRAGPVTRLLDGWAARVARYEPARRDYALLTELPDRLAEHAARMAEAAEAAARALAAHEAAAVAADPALAAPLALHDAFDRAEDAVEAAHAALDAAERRRAALSAGEDAATRAAVAALEAALSRQGLRALRAAAARTPTPRDDAVVARMEGATAERAMLDGQVRDRRAEADAARARVQELLALRQEMRQRGYSRDNWSFSDGAMLGVLLSEVLRGALSRDGFWDRMGQHRVPGGGPWGAGGRMEDGVWGSGTPGPWGSGGPIPRGLPRGPWGAPGGGGGGWKTGGGFGGSGGGFRTGGSIGGGGGFKTGGSF